ncbi:Long-chain fatty acid transport protein [Minicystis rosea]|nr:Long-chain fatty acid transport protein [Minicystis rosea]
MSSSQSQRRARSISSRAAALAVLAAAFSATSGAEAGGLYYSDRGVRPLGRAGAFVAGADDAGALMYNPAGIFDAGGQVLVDGSWVQFSSDYTRQALVQQVDPNTGQPVGNAVRQTFPKVSGSTPFLPIPTLAATVRVHKQVVLGFGVWAPYAALASYPETLQSKPSPQRYSLISLDGSLLAFVGAGVAFAPIKELRLGAEVGVLTGVFKTRATFSGCVPERFLCAPEQPAWDVAAQLDAGPIVAPTGQVGVTYVPTPAWRVGVAVQLPVYVRAPAKLQTRLPATPVFEKATQEGDAGHLAFDLPWSIRAGVETRMVDNLRVEVSFNFDRWSMHDAITLTPDNIALKNVAGFPQTYNLPPVTLVRNFQDSVGIHAGAEYTIPKGRFTFVARGGVSFETSAIPNAYTSVLTIDQNKVTTALGGSVHIGKLRLDATYAHVFGMPVNVDPKDARIPLTSPVEANPPKNPTYINGGNYSARANVIGLGLAYTFDPSPVDAPPPPAGPPPAGPPRR